MLHTLPASTNHHSINCTLIGRLTLWHGLGDVFTVDVMFNFEQPFYLYLFSILFCSLKYLFDLGFS